MAERVVYGIDRRVVSDRQLLAALADIAQNFDANPKEMACAFAEGDSDIRWFTFRASAWGPDVTMVAEFFEDMFELAKLDFVTVKRATHLADDVIVKAYRSGKVQLIVGSDGSEIAINHGTVGASVPRLGDAETFALAALGWSTTVPRDTFTTKSERIVLRRGHRSPAKLVIEKGGTKLPPVTVTRNSPPVELDVWRESSSEVFPVKRVAASVPTGKPIKVSVSIGASGAWVDLSSTQAITGSITINDDYDPSGGEYGVRVVDLGAVREMKYPCTLSVGGACEKIVARELEIADWIVIKRGAYSADHGLAVSFPKLRTLRGAHIELPDFKAGSFELPALESVKHEVRIRVEKYPFTIRLPKLASGQVLFQSYGADPKAIARSRFEAPHLSLDQIKFEGGFAALLKRIPGLPTTKTITQKQSPVAKQKPGKTTPKKPPVAKQKPGKPATKRKR